LRTSFASARSDVTASGAGVHPKIVRVLAVDDQPSFRKVARAVVDATAGFAWAGEAGSGAEALEVVRASGADVVIVDVRMPDMDGIEAARRITIECPRVTVLLVSADPLVSPAADLQRSRASMFARKQELGPALLRRVEMALPPAASGTEDP
jgi:two-component system, NarL family, invasion response regulator UvrY